MVMYTLLSSLKHHCLAPGCEVNAKGSVDVQIKGAPHRRGGWMTISPGLLTVVECLYELIQNEQNKNTKLCFFKNVFRFISNFFPVFDDIQCGSILM